VPFPEPIYAYDQDRGINATIEYEIISGNDAKYFEIDSKRGKLYLVKEIDRETLNFDAFHLQIQATQTDDGTKFGLAGVKIEIIDLNDNRYLS